MAHKFLIIEQTKNDLSPNDPTVERHFFIDAALIQSKASDDPAVLTLGWIPFSEREREREMDSTAGFVHRSYLRGFHDNSFSNFVIFETDWSGSDVVRFIRSTFDEELSEAIRTNAIRSAAQTPRENSL